MCVRLIVSVFVVNFQDKKVEVSKLALDKPSNKFLSFLKKHYGLSKIYPQNNNFLVFEGFFAEANGTIQNILQEMFLN